MTKTSPCPAGILALLPWYPELDADDRDVVESHAAQCRECRLEIELVSGGPLPPTPLPDQEAILARIFSRIDDAVKRRRKGRGSRILEVIFRNDKTQGEVTRALREVGASIVSGPNARGRYELVLPAGADTRKVVTSLVRPISGVARAAALRRPRESSQSSGAPPR